jgi:predicted aldo/keto reductase-like oxidoreductase
MPWTTIPPDENGDFKNWLYNNKKTCKETQDACYRYEDLRTNRFVFPEPTQNPSKIEK